MSVVATAESPVSTDASPAYRDVASLLAQGSRFVLTGHRSPDGDSLGSALALADALGRAGKDAVVTVRDAWASSLDFLPGIDRVVVAERLPADWPAGFDALLALECPSAERTGYPEIAAGRVVNIDHHPGNTRYGALNLVETSAAAAGEIVAGLLDLLDWPLTPEIATNLWVALVSDTGSFRYASTTPRALALGARLVAAGARPGDVNERLFESRPAAALALEARVLGTLALHADGRVATLELPHRFLVETGAADGDAEGLVNRARGIAGVRAAVLLSEAPGEVVRCSLRSKGELDVRSVAERHGGGGHRNAAGCELSGTLADARATLTDELERLVAEEAL